MIRRAKPSGPGRPLLLAAAVALTHPVWVHADLILQAGSPSYPLGTDGEPQTQVPIFLTQTGSTTILTDQGGINQFQARVFPVLPVAAERPTLVSIVVNPQFLGNKPTNLSTGEMGGAFFDLTSGVPAVDGRVFLGTYTFTGSPTLPTETTFSITTPNQPGFNFTAADTDLAGMIQPGSFTLVIPEPKSLGLLALLGVGLVRRRRSSALTFARAGVRSESGRVVRLRASEARQHACAVLGAMPTNPAGRTGRVLTR